MLFNSLEFAIFFPVVVALYFALPHNRRTLMLLIASCVFYMAFVPAYILILFVTILIDYIAGIRIEDTDGRARKGWLVSSIISTCVVLFVFKYFHFFVGNFTYLANVAGWKIPDPVINILLPIGLSFHTFQSLSYVVEVYRGHQKAERDFITYATYVMFFPQLVAGPIERPQNMLHQFYETHDFDENRVISGLKRIAWGFFKKLVIADRLALYVSDVYGSPHESNGLQLTIATIFFAYQIYCDFSGYSDIAVGTARILGFRMMENFDTPYCARSISEFWRRWHISLSTWFRDYVYFPLGGNRVSSARWMRNILITFGISGLWHGANWTYVVWGLINGAYLIIGAVTTKQRARLRQMVGLQEQGAISNAMAVLTTFVLICFAWIVFRARNMGDAIYILTHLLSNWNFGEIATEHFLMRQFPIAVLAIIFLETVQYCNRRTPVVSFANQMPRPLRWAGYVAMVFGVILFGVFQKNQFIYFQF